MLSTITPFSPQRQAATTMILAELHDALELQEPDLIIRQLRLLRDSGDMTALASIRSYFWHKYLETVNGEVLTEWNTTIETLVQCVPIHGYFWFHSQRKAFYSGRGGEGLTIASTFDHNGRIREEAVRTLDDADSRVIAAQIVRLVDWVEPIRRFVELNLSALLEIDMISHATLVEGLPLIVELARYDVVSPAIQACFHEYLRRNILILIDGLNHSEMRIARAASIIAKALPVEQHRELLEIGLNSPDPMVRLHWAEVGLAAESTRQLVYDCLQNERVPALRVAVLRAQAQAENIQGALESGLFESSARMRQFCQFALRQHGMHAQELYRAVLDQPASAKTESALLGLAECGDHPDLDYALFYLDSPVLRIRYAALWLLSKYTTDEHQAIFWQLLDDPIAKVARLAARVLKAKSFLSYAEWFARYDAAELPLKRLLLHSARRFPWEQRKEAYTKALSDPMIDASIQTIIKNDRRFRMYIDV